MSVAISTLFIKGRLLRPFGTRNDNSLRSLRASVFYERGNLAFMWTRIVIAFFVFEIDSHVSRYEQSRIMKKLFLLIFFFPLLHAQPPCNTPAPYHCTDMTMNSLFCNVYNNGAHRNFYIQNGSTYSLLFNQAQLMMGAMVNNQIRTSYGYSPPAFAEYSPGPLINGLPDTTYENYSTKYKVYRIAKDWQSMRESPTKEQYRNDYNNWPAELGAPVDSSGKPLFLGDQTTWCVWNDVDTMDGRGYRVPLGAEVQMTTWSYSDDPILQNVLFVKHTIINKSDTLWKDFYAGNYLYGNVAGAGSYAGMDSVLGLEYLYSWSSSTNTFGPRIPSFGYVSLQGPIVSKPGGMAFNFGRYIPDAVNLPARGGSTFPVTGLYFIPPRLYLALSGLNPTDSSLYVDPTTGKSTRFTFTGDPVTNSGWTERTYYGTTRPNNREIMLSAGPVDVAPNDTVTIVGAYIAGRGKDNFHSVAILKHFARYLKGIYPSLLSPVTVPRPNISTSVLSGKVILTWDVAAEQNLVNGYKFQGYNVYQGETKNGPWHRIFTADKKDNVVILSEETYQPEFSSLSQRGIQSLPNAGLQHHLIVERDTINGTPLIDGRPYYFTVRAIWENSENRPMAIESEIVSIPSTPESAVPGSKIVDPLSVIPHNRIYDDALTAEVIDPLKLTSGKYRVVVHNTNDTISWDVINEETNSPVYIGLTTIAGESTPIIDGFTIRLRKQSVGVRRDQQTPKGWEYLPEKNRWLTGASPTLIMDAFDNGLVYPRTTAYTGRGGSKTKSNELKRLEVRFSNSVTQKAYRFVDKVRGFPFNDPPKHPSFAPFILKKGVGYVYQDMVDVPFTVWEIDSLDGDLAPKQLAVGFLETNDSLYSTAGKYLGRGNVNGKWEPTTAANGGGEILFFFSSAYTETPQPQYINPAVDLFFRPDSFDVMYLLSSRTDTTLKKQPPYTYQDGDIFRITPNYQLNDGQTYYFTSSSGIVGSKSLAFEQNAMEKISVFPNPYMGGHALEQSPSQRFVRIINLSAPSTIRIFNLSGRLIRSFEHTSATSGITDWDLRNDEGIKVASGLYLIHIESPGIGTKVLKLMVLYPDERLNAY
jgi:hypothetical protein